MKSKNEKIFLILIGVASGFVNGFFGGGGGMIVVPLLIYLEKLPAKIAHATSILIILPISIVSSIIYLSYSTYNFSIGLPVGIGVVLGGVIGSFCLKNLKSKWLNFIFIALMFLSGLKLLFF